MKRSLLPLLALALVVGCSRNRVSTRSVVPFSIGSVKTALFYDTSYTGAEGYGQGALVLTSEDWSCASFADELRGEVEHEDLHQWTASGMAASFVWASTSGDDLGWEGAYWQGFQSFGYYGAEYGESDVQTRLMASLLFSEGVVYDDYGTGVGEILEADANSVRGRVDTDAHRARFAAEHCGQLEDGTDTIYAIDTG